MIAPWRCLTGLLALLVLCFGTGFTPPQWSRDDAGALPLPPSQVRALRGYKSPVLSARTAVLVDAASGAVLFTKNGDERAAPASLTKMMTALVAIEHGDLNQKITASERVYVEPVVIGLDPGEVMSLEDLLYGLLLPSGNDAAVAIAEGVGGTQARFVGWMNEKAAALGMRNTHFLNPHGLDAPGHYSTGEDLARLTVAMMRDPHLARIVGSREYTRTGPPLYKFRNSNPLLGTYDGVNGGKTGFTDLAGRCLAVSATRGGHQLVAIILGSQNIALDGQTLLDYAYGNYDWVAVPVSNSPLLDYRIGRERVETGLVAPPAVPLSPWEGREYRGRVVLDRGAPEASGLVGWLVLESPLRRLGQFALSVVPSRS
jgi:serine-type D-Ala-D-Ala carboxypeptidase (penicillin-binding protein 5/6)